MKKILIWLAALSRPAKQAVLVVSDLVALPVLYWLALAIRHDSFSPEVLSGTPSGLLGVGVLCVSVLGLAGVYQAVVRAFDERFLHLLFVAVAIIVVVLFSVAVTRFLFIPRSVPLIYGFFVFLWIWASRSIIRLTVNFVLQAHMPTKRVAIYGAGAAGRQILAALRAAPEYFPVAFFDDDSGMAGTRVQGLRVYSGNNFERDHVSLDLDEVLIALPSTSRARRREIIDRLEPFKVHVRTLPGFTQLVGGEISIADIHEVDVADLLGRDSVPPLEKFLHKDIQGKRVMVTGAGGSIGSELCRQVLDAKPDLLLLWEIGEYALYSIEQELKAKATSMGVTIIPVLGSVLNQGRMATILTHYGVDTVYHAAAYKHVPLVEWNPFEGIMNNAVGTLHAAKAAVAAKVSSFVLISTDKAVRPTNVMGASKRLAELALQALAADSDTTTTRFCMVRFGNVLGSSGSVVPLFREQIARGGPVTVTHPDVTRYFMTIPEAAQLVIQAGAMGVGGDVFVLDMGKPVKIVDLARKMIRLSGMSVREPGSPDGDIEIAFSGLRPGEKLYEELLIGSNVTGTGHSRIMRAMEEKMPLIELEALMDALREMARVHDVASLKLRLSEVIEGYVPDMSVMGLADVHGVKTSVSAASVSEKVIALKREV